MSLQINGVNGQRPYRPVWRCIYCDQKHSDKDRLGKEHIVPFFLVGHALILPRSSCAKCSCATKNFETLCAREMFGEFRIVMNSPTRNPQERPATLPITVNRQDTSTVIQLPISEYPYVNLTLPQFGLADLFTGRKSPPEGQRAKLRWLSATKKNVVPSIERPAEVEHTSKLLVEPLYKLLCKIAHSFAVAERGLDAHEWLLRDVIVGEARNYADFVGGVEPLRLDTPYSGSFLPDGDVNLPAPTFSVGLVRAGGPTGVAYWAVRIALFFDFVPPYLVIVAKA